MISVIVPFSRPWCLKRVADNFRRQRYPDKRLVVIENGAALGVWDRHNLEPQALLSSGPHLSLAKNTGIEWVRQHGGGFWTTFDDDDWYGPHYLERLAGHIRKGEVVGAPRHLVELSDGVHLFNYERRHGGHVECLHGATLGAWAEESVEFPLVRLGEEAAFCSNMKAQGAKIWSIGAGDYIYRRHGQHHVWRATDLQVRRATGPSWLNGHLIPTPTDAEIFAELESV